jgi:eukaryotic-like serine/threonine-protein kinase
VDVLTQTSPDATRQVAYRKQAGEEPLPGYVLTEPLGKGGFGEVWKCVAPGGLMKAIKFITNTAEGTASNSLDVEFEAFQKIKALRHPVLLTLEQVIHQGDELLMVMELADFQMQDLFRAYNQQGHPGIPRNELLGYMIDVAEVLDWFSQKHGLQHLDVKPANLFLISGRVKVGDYGLVRPYDLSQKAVSLDRGLTPRYVAPEVLHGRVDPRSDQYCLALVYMEMLTGVFPYNARSAQQMMLQHASVSPNVAPLPMTDQYIVSKALSKAAIDRYPSCMHFISELISAATHQETLEQTQDTWAPKAPAQRRTQEFDLPPVSPRGDGLDPSSLTGRMTQPPMGAGRAPQLTTQTRPQIKPNVPTLNSRTGAPQRSTPSGRGTQYHSQGIYGQEPVETAEVISLTPASAPARLQRVWSVLPTHVLHDPTNSNEFISTDPNNLISAVVSHASPDGQIPQIAGKPLRQLDGTWVSRFPIRPITGVAKIKLELLKETWKAEIDVQNADEFLIRRYIQGGFWDRMNGKKSGLIVHVKLPPAGVSMGQATLTGSIFGPADAALTRGADELIPEMLQEVLKILNNADDRRKAVRLDVNWSATLFPVSSDGIVGRPLAGQMRDISLGGMCAVVNGTIDSAYVYTVFQDVPHASNWAILTRLNRATPDGANIRIAGKFRTDLV